jgi:predicted acyl esterase
MVPMRDGTRLNTFVFLPESGGPRFPVILHRTPYGIAAADARDKFDHTNAWLRREWSRPCRSACRVAEADPGAAGTPVCGYF